MSWLARELIRFCVLAGLWATTAGAQRGARSDLELTPDIVTTHHQVTVGGSVLRYTARAGCLPIRDNEAGDVHANMCLFAYALDRAPDAPTRPLTFLWNGGPGSHSGPVHLMGFGPRRVVRATGTVPNELRARRGCSSAFRRAHRSRRWHNISRRIRRPGAHSRSATTRANGIFRSGDCLH